MPWLQAKQVALCGEPGPPVLPCGPALRPRHLCLRGREWRCWASREDKGHVAFFPAVWELKQSYLRKTR